MAKRNSKENQDWLNLVRWLEINIFNYDETKKYISQRACLILKGLQRGQYIANHNTSSNVNYPADVLLIAFKINKTKILNAIKNKQFKDENQKMTYVCSLVRDDLDDVYNRYLKINNS